MVSHVADTLFNRLIDAFPPDRAYTREMYSRDPMPGPLAQYLDAGMQVRLLAETQVRDGWFDADHPDVVRASRAYREALKRHQRIPADAWADFLRSACGDTAAYLIRPVSTLPDFVFAEGSASVKTEDVFERLDHFPAYPYFREVIEAYFARKKVDSIDRARFENLLRRIDRQMTGDYGGDDWAKLLQPLVSMLFLIPEYSGRIPVDVLRAFFAEKDAADVVARLDSRYVAKGYKSIDESELRDLFVDRQRGADLVEPTSQQSAEMNGPPAIKSREDSADGVGGDGPVPLWKQFEKDVSISAGSSRPRTPERDLDAGVSAAPSAQPLWKQFRSGSEEAPKEGTGAGRIDHERREEARGDAVRIDRMNPTENLAAIERTVLGERGRRNRNLFLTHLFNGSEDDYEQTLRQLARASNWSEASKIIASEVFKKHQVNIYSGPAVAFTDAAEAQFVS